METRAGIYRSLEARGDREKDMGVLQKLDVLEERMAGIAEERRKRGDLETRQAEIEAHRLYVHVQAAALFARQSWGIESKYASKNREDL